MESIIRNVKDLPTDERRVYEGVLGQRLRENQQVIVQVITLKETPEQQPSPTGVQAGPLPAWCNVYEGLSDEEIADVETVILRRADLTRASD